MSKPVGKYFDHYGRCAIDLDKDGCDFSEWERSSGRALFATHSEGFLVFLAAHSLEDSDEYNRSDPYSVEARIHSDFQRRRIECTLYLVREAATKIHGAPKILDLGCGQGHITSKIKQEVPTAELSGLDYSISAIKYANKHFPDIDFIVGNAYSPPYARGYFDIVVCNNLWEHVPDPLTLLGRISAIMKPRGSLIVSTPSRYRWANLINAIRGRPMVFMSEHHVTEYSVGQVMEQLRYGGFKVLKCFSRPLISGNWKFEIAKKLFSVFASVTGSHHQLEATVFYLAQRVDRDLEKNPPKTWTDTT